VNIGCIPERWTQKRASGAISELSRPGQRPKSMSERCSISSGVVSSRGQFFLLPRGTTSSDLDSIGGAPIRHTFGQPCFLRNAMLLAQIIDSGVAQCSDDRKNGHHDSHDYTIPRRYPIVTKVEDKWSDNQP
jgi:hypothetical protein